MLQIDPDNLLKILKKYKNSTKYTICQSHHIQIVLNLLRGVDKDNNYCQLFDIMQESLSVVASMKFLILIHKLLYYNQKDFAARFILFKLLPGDQNYYSKLIQEYYNFIYNICLHYQQFEEVIDFIENDDITKFLEYNITEQIQILLVLVQLLQEISKVVKLLDHLLYKESPLLLQLGECILKDFSVIYNFLSTVMQLQQTYILQLPQNDAKSLYQVYQITIQMTKRMKRFQQLKLCSNFKQPNYFNIIAELNKKIELHMLNTIKLSNIEISI